MEKEEVGRIRAIHKKRDSARVALGATDTLSISHTDGKEVTEAAKTSRKWRRMHMVTNKKLFDMK